MMLTNRQHAVLADLGISVWQRRQQAVSVSENTPSPATLTDSAMPAINTADAMLLVIVDKPLEGNKQLLLGAILKAVGLTPEMVATLSSQEFEQISSQQERKPMLIFGDAAEREAADPHSYVCPGLEEMLQQPQRKAHAWQTLQKLKLVL